MSERVLTEVALQLLSRHPAACECFRCRSLRDLLDVRRERDEARPVLEAVRRLNAARFADWTDYHLEDSLGWALKWGPAEWEAEVSAVIAIRAVAAARAAAKEVG